MKNPKDWLRPDGKWNRDRLSSVIVDALIIIAAIVLFFSYGTRLHRDEVDPSAHEAAGERDEDLGDVLLFDNLRIGKVDISGLTVNEARAKVQDYVDGILNMPFERIVSGQHSVPATLRELSVFWANPQVLEETAALRDKKDPIESYKLEKDIETAGMDLPLEIGCDKAFLMDYLRENCTAWDVPMTAAEMVTENGKMKIIPGTPGQELNISEAAAAIENVAFAQLERNDTLFILPVMEMYPPSIPDGYEGMEGIEELVEEAAREQAEAEAAAQEEQTEGEAEPEP